MKNVYRNQFLMVFPTAVFMLPNGSHLSSLNSAQIQNSLFVVLFGAFKTFMISSMSILLTIFSVPSLMWRLTWEPRRCFRFWAPLHVLQTLTPRANSKHETSADMSVVNNLNGKPLHLQACGASLLKLLRLSGRTKHVTSRETITTILITINIAQLSEQFRNRFSFRLDRTTSTITSHKSIYSFQFIYITISTLAERNNSLLPCYRIFVSGLTGMIQKTTNMFSVWKTTPLSFTMSVCPYLITAK
jgi:hypothetical protein